MRGVEREGRREGEEFIKRGGGGKEGKRKRGEGGLDDIRYLIFASPPVPPLSFPFTFSFFPSTILDFLISSRLMALHIPCPQPIIHTLVTLITLIKLFQPPQLAHSPVPMHQCQKQENSLKNNYYVSFIHFIAFNPPSHSLP